MYKKTIKYVDYDGNERTEDFYFNLTETEITELEFSEPGGMTALIEKVVNTNEYTKMIPLWKKIILMSYGEKSPDGRRFIKSDELSTAFSQTEAFNVMFMEFAQNAEAATDFVNAVLPKSISEKEAQSLTVLTNK